MQQVSNPSRRVQVRRAMSLLLALVMLLGLVPGLPAEEASAHWADPYLSQLVEWGFIRPDQAGYPDRALTRADFMAIVNRAYGYHEFGETPFVDVEEEDWFYDDVGVAYTARYIKGTSPTTASPNSTLTRETAATVLGRNMMLQESVGEILDFTDARSISSWAKGTIKASLEHYLVSGYNDNTFRPQRAVSWGEMASMVTNIVGTPLQESGDYSLGGVYGNVTITSPNVTLRDTVISGDLYVTGGVGLGNVVLENVTVLGRIIASGTGSSEGGEDSIVLRNVVADELLVDNLQDHHVSVRADGVTDIGRTTVRTSAYIEDNTPDGMGLKYISLEGESYPEGEEPEDWQPIQVDLAGRIGEVVNKTPQSQVRAAAGTVAKLTVDEAAVESTVIIDRGAVVKELNLDTSTEVTGEGDIEKLVVNAPDCSVEMLPDQIEIRPGITADIAGETMDSVAGKESTMDPMILAGYPQATDITPNSLEALFCTNKSGTVYWAVSAVTDGSVGEEELIKPPSYGNIAVKNGSVKVPKGNEEVSSKISGLTPGGSYYLSAILVDARGQRSAVKVISFTTPDNTKPAFCNGYPRMSKVSRTDSVVVVMPTKSCKLYYALLPEGAAAPTEDELKTNSVSGALGYGVRDVVKNKEDAFRVNDTILDEVTNYILYLWLTDGVNKSAIVKLKFKTDDETPPEFIVDPAPEKQTANSVSLKFQLSEPGTVYWVAFPTGSVENYPKPPRGSQLDTAPLNSPDAIQQVVNGMNIGPDGKSGKVSVRANSDGACIGTFNITGMKPETTYEVYYVAKDNAGADRNYSVMVKHITVSPKDEKGPVFTQDFELKLQNDKTRPQANSDIYIDVSEDVYYQGKGGSKSLLELYQETQTGSASSREEAVNLLAQILRDTIELHKFNAQTKREETTAALYKFQTGDTSTTWEIDYTKAIVTTRKEGGIRITFPKTGLKLASGGQYCFKISKLEDMSGNSIEPNGEVYFWGKNDKELAPIKKPGHDVPDFIVEAPWVELGEPDSIEDYPMIRKADGTISNDKARWDMWFYMIPHSTRSVSENVRYDVLLWSRTPMQYDLYYRVVAENTHEKLHRSKTEDGKTSYYYPDTSYLLTETGTDAVDENGWIYLGNSAESDPIGENGYSGRSVSVSRQFINCDNDKLGRLKFLQEGKEYQFFISLTSNNHKDEPDTWSEEDTAKMEVNVASGASNKLYQLGTTLTHGNWESALEGGDVTSIGRWIKNNEHTIELERKYSIKKLPDFDNLTPSFTPMQDGSLEMGISLDDNGTVHYAIFEIDPMNGRSPLTTTRKLIDGSSDYKYDENNNAYEVSDDVVPSGTDGEMYITPKSPRPPIKSGEEERPDWMVATTNEKGELVNQVTAPIPKDITSGNFSTRVIDSDNLTPVKNEVTPVTITADKLTPGRTYFAYFVITAASDADIKSPVYIYQFTMPAPKKPSLLPSSDSDGSVSMSIDILTEGDAFRVTTLSNATNGNISILQKPFNLYTGYKGTGGRNKTPDRYMDDDFSVLNALTTPYSYNQASRGDDDPYSGKYYYPEYDGSRWEYEQGYTVFDMYASEDARNHLYTFIRDGVALDKSETVNITSPGPWNNDFDTEAPDVKKEEKRKVTELKTNKGTTIGEELSDQSGDTYYIFVYARNPDMMVPGQENSADSTYKIASFTAYKFSKGEMVPPNVINASQGSTPFKKEGNGATYSGSVRIRFDRDVFLRGDADIVPITTENLLTGQGVILFGEDENGNHHGKISVSGISSDGFTINFSGIQNGDSLIFPGNYFANSENQGNKLNDLTITVTSEKIIIKWPSSKDSPWEIPLLDEEPGEGTLLIMGGGTQGPSGSKKTLALEAGRTSGTITAMLDSGNFFKETYIWTAPVNDGVIHLLDPNNGDSAVTRLENNTIKIKGLKPGTATVKLIGRGETESGDIVPKEGSIDVTVTGTVEPFTTVSTNSMANFNAGTKTLTMYLGSTASPSATFIVKANGESLSSTAAISVEKGGANPGSVVCTPGANGTLTIAPATGNNGAKIGHTATITIGLKIANTTTDLTPGVNAKQTITVKFEEAPDPGTTYNLPNRAPSQAVPESLSFVNVSGAKLTSGVVKMSGSSMKSVISAVISPSRASGTIKWESSNPSVASVTPSGSRGTIQGLSTGTATIKAYVAGTDVENSFLVTVTADISIDSFKAKSDKSTITSTDGGFTWSQKSSTSGAAATLTFSTGLSLDNAKITVTSSDDDAVQVGKVNRVDEKTRSVQLIYAYKNPKGEVTITVKVGEKTKTFKIKLEEQSVLSNLAKAAKK